MSCEKIRQQLHDYVDGELSSAARRRVEKHLGGCSDCSDELEELRSLLDAAAAMSTERQPECDLWPAIESRLERHEPAVSRGAWWSASWVGLAAAAVLVAAVTSQVVRQGDEQTSPAEVTDPVTAEVASLGSEPSYAVVSEEARARDGLQQVREDLLRTIIERRQSLDPEAQELVDQNLELIDQAIAEIYRALEENPENQRLEFLLAATYQREVEFLKKMNLL